MANAPHLPRDGRSYAGDLLKKLSGIFSTPGLDTVSENQKRFARRVDLSRLRIAIALARKANQFAVRSFVGWAKR
jgi:hypothetical protein